MRRTREPRINQRRARVLPVLLLSFALSGCDLWPENLEPLANAIAAQVSGTVTA